MPISLTRPGPNHHNLTPNWLESPRNSEIATPSSSQFRRSLIHRTQDGHPFVVRAEPCAIDHKCCNPVCY